MNTIETLEQWQDLRARLSAAGYRIWQMQYDTRSHQGFHVWFCVTGRPDLAFVTHSDDVYNAIIQYK